MESKISGSEIAFANEFRQIDPELKTAFIIAKGRANTTMTTSAAHSDLASRVKDARNSPSLHTAG